MNRKVEVMRMRIRMLVMAVVLGYAGVASAVPVTLGQLMNAGVNGTVTCDDKVFSGFSATAGNDAASQALLGQALALMVNCSVVNGVDYLDFSGPLTVLNGSGSTSLMGDVLLHYTVTATGGHVIGLIDQVYTPNAPLGSGQISIGESAVGATASASSQLSFNPLVVSDPANGVFGPNLTLNPGQTSLTITKDINILANPGVISIGLSDVQQSFHQIPDGGLTLALLGFAMVGVEGLRRRLAK
jgi:hypothetical protein